MLQSIESRRHTVLLVYRFVPNTFSTKFSIVRNSFWWMGENFVELAEFRNVRLQNAISPFLHTINLTVHFFYLKKKQHFNYPGFFVWWQRTILYIRTVCNTHDDIFPCARSTSHTKQLARGREREWNTVEEISNVFWEFLLRLLGYSVCVCGSLGIVPPYTHYIKHISHAHSHIARNNIEAQAFSINAYATRRIFAGRREKNSSYQHSHAKRNFDEHKRKKLGNNSETTANGYDTHIHAHTHTYFFSTLIFIIIWN